MTVVVSVNRALAEGDQTYSVDGATWYLFNPEARMDSGDKAIAGIEGFCPYNTERA